MKNTVLPYCSRFFIFENQNFSNNMRFVSLADNQDIQEVYNDEHVTIRDVKDITSKKETYRQLVYKNAPNEVETEMKLFNVSEMDAKSSTYTPVKTVKQIKNKKKKTCVETNLIISHYVRVALSAMHFMDCSNWEEKPLEILVLGASVGLIPHFTKKIFNKYVNVTAVEENAKLKALGKEYFGLENDNKDINWVANSGIKFLQSKKDHNLSVANSDKKDSNEANKKPKKLYKYDLIILNEMNLDKDNKVSPNPEYFSSKHLTEIRVR